MRQTVEKKRRQRLRVILAAVMAAALLALYWLLPKILETEIPSPETEEPCALLLGYDAGFNLGQSLSNTTVTMDMAAADGTIVEGMPSKLTVTEDTVKAVADAGFTYIRCIVDFGANHSIEWEEAAFADEFIKSGAKDFSFTIDPRWFSKLREIIAWCRKYELKFVLCLSNAMALKTPYSYSYEEGGPVYERTVIYWAQPNETFSTYALLYLSKVWKQIASEFSDIDSDALAYEIVNEPLNRVFYHSAGLTGEDIWDDWSGSVEALAILEEYEQTAIKAIREEESDKLIIVPTYAHNLKQSSLKSAVKIAESDENAAVGFHWYYPQDICGNNVTTLNAAFRADDRVFQENLTNIREAREKNIPLICTEGAVEADTKFVPMETQKAWFQSIRDIFLLELKIPFALFDNGSLYDGLVAQDEDEDRSQSEQDYGFLDRKTNAWYNEENIFTFTGKQ